MSTQPRAYAVRPLDEKTRLEAVLSYCILDTPGERVFDELTSLAASHFGVPIALISIMGDDYKFFKAAIGTTLTRMERDLSFCSHCILGDEVMVVPDTRQDVRFLDNPLVTGETSIHFYAGAPLVTKGGVRLGTFCILGREPNETFDLSSQESLQRFAYIASELIEQRILPQALEKAELQNAALEQRTKQEMAASQAKTDFLSNVSHEIRTPMNGILGMLQLLTGTPLDAEQLHYAEVAQSSGSTLLALIDDLLDLSKIEAGKTTIDALAFDLSRSLQDVVEMWRIQSHTKGLRFSLCVGPSVPRRLIGDPGRLRQVLNNLISNALKFTYHGSITIRVDSIKDLQASATIRFSISDTGIGMTEDQSKALFQPFTQADASTTRKYGGSGLGLFISKRLVELMQGEIGIDSVPEVGSTFWFTIKLLKQSSATCLVESDGRELGTADIKRAYAQAVCVERLADQTIVTQNSSDDKRPRRILVAEDNPTNQLVVKSQLAKLGYEFVLVANGEEAVAMVQQGHFDLVLMDCEMPGMDGYDATRNIRDLGYATLPIIAVTAHAMAGNRDACLNAGMDYYLSKPLDIGRLARTLQEWCNRARYDRSPGTRENDKEEAKASIPEIFHAKALLSRLMDDESLARLIVSSFVDTCPKQLKNLRHCAKSRDSEGLRLHAHALKGAAATVSAERLSGMAYQLEISAHKPEASMTLCRELDRAFQEFLESAAVVCLR